MRSKLLFFSAIGMALAAAPADAAAPRLVVVPVTVGSGGVPADDMLAALAKGLEDNRKWQVEHGPALDAAAAPASSVSDEQVSALSGKVAHAAEQLAAGNSAEAVKDLESVRAELRQAAELGPRGEKGDSLAYRAGGLLVASLLASNQEDRAKTLAEEVALSFPERKPTEPDQIPAAAVALLGAPVAAAGPKLILKTRPEGCEIFVNGRSVGRSTVELVVQPGVTYYAQSSCSTVGAAQKSFNKKIFVAANEVGRQEVLDAEFEKALSVEGGVQLRFQTGSERKQLEDSYARRVAERFGADVVVFASIGELNGADWLSARLYLRSGYLNRQGLVRLEVPRATALGRYLATGRDTPGVLKAEEASALAASDQPAAPSRAPQRSPWYTDVMGWTLSGVGIVGMAFGQWNTSRARAKTREADDIRGDSERQDKLYKDAQRTRFWGDIGTIGGGLTTLVGIVLLAVPEYAPHQEERLALTPARGGGGTLTWYGRF